MVERLSPSVLAPGESSWGQRLYIAAHRGTTVSVVKGCAIAGFWLHRAGVIPPPAYSANYSAQGAFGGKKVPKRAVKTGRGGASTAYEKTPDPLEEPGVFVEKSRVRAEGLEPSTQGLKV